MKKIVAYLLCVIVCGTCLAQDTETVTPVDSSGLIYNSYGQPVQHNYGYVNILADARITMLSEKYKRVNANTEEIEGWRIQIVQSTNRQDVYSKRVQVRDFYSGIKTYITYEQPDYKLRVGNFLDRFEAYKALKKLRERFGSAFIVKAQLKKIDIQ